MFAASGNNSAVLPVGGMIVFAGDALSEFEIEVK